MNKERIKDAVRDELNSVQKDSYDPVSVEMDLRDLTDADIEMMIRDMPGNDLDRAESEREIQRTAAHALRSYISDNFGTDAARGERDVIEEIARDFAQGWFAY